MRKTAKTWNGPRKFLNKLLVAVRHCRLGLPDTIGIEISTACDRRCSYCPQSIVKPKQEIIDGDLFNLFVDRVKEAGWKGIVGISGWAEPSLVKNSHEYVKAIADIGAKPSVFTNGRDPQSIADWIDAGACRVVITEHEPFTKYQGEEIRRLAKRHRVIVTIKRIDESTLISKMGDWPVKIGGLPMTKCQFSEAVGYNVKGKAYLCCIDYACEYSTGDLSVPILDLWFSSKYQTIRKLVQSGKPVNKLCQKCLIG